VLNSEVTSTGFISNNRNGFSLNAFAQRYQNFQSTTPNDNIVILHIPSLEAATVDRRIGSTPLYWNFDVAAAGLAPREPGFATADYVGRIDVHPEASLPLAYKGWSLRTAFGLRDTYYSQRRISSFGVGIGDAVDEPVNRHDFDFTAELRPPT